MSYVVGFLAAVALSIIAPDKFAAVSKFVRSIPGRIFKAGVSHE